MAITQLQRTESTHWRAEETKIINGTPVRFRDICVHEIRIGDVEEPSTMVDQSIREWQQTDRGKFITEHAVGRPYWSATFDPITYSNHYRIIARLSEQNQTYWLLKWSATN